MKQCVKRLFCPTCRKLVKCQEKTEGGKLQLICNKCGNPVQVKERASWRYVEAAAK